jgi:hypothetical protein
VSPSLPDGITLERDHGMDFGPSDDRNRDL